MAKAEERVAQMWKGKSTDFIVFYDILQFVVAFF